MGRVVNAESLTNEERLWIGYYSQARGSERAGRAIALMGVVLPLLLIGHSKFAAFEVEALKPLIGGTPWLAWMYAVSSAVGVSRFLGVIEIATAFLDIDLMFRLTVGLRRIDGEWTVMHEHHSIPATQ